MRDGLSRRMLTSLRLSAQEVPAVRPEASRASGGIRVREKGVRRAGCTGMT